MRALVLVAILAGCGNQAYTGWRNGKPRSVLEGAEEESDGPVRKTPVSWSDLAGTSRHDSWFDLGTSIGSMFASSVPPLLAASTMKPAVADAAKIVVEMWM